MCQFVFFPGLTAVTPIFPYDNRNRVTSVSLLVCWSVGLGYLISVDKNRAYYRIQLQ